MRKGLAIAALICGILGILGNVNNWFLTIYVLDYVGWQGPLLELSNLSWLLGTVSIGLGVVFLAVAFMSATKTDTVEYEEVYEASEFLDEPPPIPSAALNPPTLSTREWPKRST